MKVLRPGVEQAIAQDVLLLQTAAGLVERLWADGRRLKPREVVAEFARHLEEELDLVREAAMHRYCAGTSRIRPCWRCPRCTGTTARGA